MLLLLDNYDSFTYNLSQYLLELTEEEVVVLRNDEILLDDIQAFSRIVLSPGPGLPESAGILLPLLERYALSKPILGICLGHQAITLAFGGKLKRLEEVLHGVSRKVIVRDPAHPLFKDIESTFDAGRYHSWVPDRNGFPACLEILGKDEADEIMILKHKERPVYGMQFHPESVLTPCGKQLLKNWLVVSG